MNKRDKIAKTVKALDGLSSSDPEEAHGKAEEEVQLFLRSIGCEDVADAFDRLASRVSFWAFG